MLRIVAGLFTVFLLNGEAAFGQAPKAVPPPQRHVVEIREFGFHPQRTLASPGDTIVWINRDIVPHTATAKDGAWRSPSLEEGESWEMVIEKSGVQAYFCEFHPQMSGVLEASMDFTRESFSIRRAMSNGNAMNNE